MGQFAYHEPGNQDLVCFRDMLSLTLVELPKVGSANPQNLPAAFEELRSNPLTYVGHG